MSLLSSIRKYAKTAAKGSLYVVGGTLLAWPVIKGAKRLYDGEGVDRAVSAMTYEGAGYNITTGELNTTKTGEVVGRDLVGIAAIFCAAKL